MESIFIKDDNSWGCTNHSQVKSSVRKIQVDGKTALKLDKKALLERAYIEGLIEEGDAVVLCTLDGQVKKSYEAKVLSLHKGDAILTITKELDENIDNLIIKIK